MTCPVLHLFLQPHLHLAMDYVNNASNSYGSGDTVSSSMASMSIHEQRHQENGVQTGHRSPADAKMKGQSRASVEGFQPVPTASVLGEAMTQPGRRHPTPPWADVTVPRRFSLSQLLNETPHEF